MVRASLMIWYSAVLLAVPDWVGGRKEDFVWRGEVLLGVSQREG